MNEQNEQREKQQPEEGKEPKLHVDKDWKKSVAEEREKLKEQEQKQRKAQDAPSGQYPEPDLRVFMAGLYAQTLAALGESENPLTHKKEQSLPEAQYLIDTIDMLKRKTQGNLSAEEESYLAGLLHDLRMRYVDAVGKPEAGQQSKAE